MDEKDKNHQPDNIIASTVITVAEGEMNLTGEQFLEWYQEKYLPLVQKLRCDKITFSKWEKVRYNYGMGNLSWRVLKKWQRLLLPSIKDSK